MILPVDNPLPPPPEDRRGWPWIAAPDRPVPREAWPTITIVTATCNQGAYIEETIRSILLQGYPNLEYIVLDGGSTDDTVPILEKYDRHLAFWTSGKDGGAADALRKGFARAGGTILAYLNSDDVYLPGTLFQAASAFRETDADLVYGNAYWIDVAGKKIGERRQAPCFARGYLYGGADILQPASFWKRDAYERVDGIDPSFTFHFDLDLFYRMVLDGARLHHIRGFLTAFRIHPESKSVTLADTYRRELNRIREKYLDHPIDSIPARVYRNLGRLHRALGYAKQGDLGWLLRRIPDRIRSRRSEVVVGPRTKWM